MSEKIMALAADQKSRLIIWLHNHRRECEECTASEIASLFTADSGINASPASINTYRVAVYPDLRITRAHNPKYTKNGGVLHGMICDLTRRVESLETFKRSLE